MTETNRLYLRDSQIRTFTATVSALNDEGAVALDRSAFYPTGGGQPHDTGSLSWDGGQSRVMRVFTKGPVVLHTIEGDRPEIGTEVHGALDWDRRHRLMRTHTALHILCGVIWNQWGVSVTGGNMEPLSARMDFEFGPLPADFASQITDLVNAEIAADRPIQVSFLPRRVALADDDLIRTKVNLIPESVDEIRVVDIVGLDKQADGGTHVASTGEVGRLEVTKTESKGRNNKRIRIKLHDH